MTKKSTEIELHPDAMERFERAIGAVVKAPPQHRASKKTKTKRASKRPKKTAR